jgi:hypothetical protein
MSDRNENFFGAHPTVLGVSGFLHKGDQTSSVYSAEHRWAANSSRAGRTISLGAARDLLGEIVNDPRFNKGNVNLATPEEMEDITGQKGLIAASAVEKDAGRHTGRALFNSNAPLTVNAVTHEASHLVNADQFKHNTFNHEWPQTRAHLVIAHNFIHPDDAEGLREAYSRGGVDFAPRNRRR